MRGSVPTRILAASDGSAAGSESAHEGREPVVRPRRAKARKSRLSRDFIGFNVCQKGKDVNEGQDVNILPARVKDIINEKTFTKALRPGLDLPKKALR